MNYKILGLIIIFILIISSICISIYTLTRDCKCTELDTGDCKPKIDLPPIPPAKELFKTNYGNYTTMQGTASEWYNVFNVDDPKKPTIYSYKNRIDSIKNQNKEFADRLQNEVATALWLDTQDHANTRLENALEYMYNNGKSYILIVIYNVPNRDCHASASNGLLNCKFDKSYFCGPDPDQKDKKTNALCEYRKYIDGIYKTLINRKYKKITYHLIIEPDCFSNIITNSGLTPSGNPPPSNNCNKFVAQGSYLPCIHYAITTLSNVKQCYLYLDVAHPLWLGWDLGIEGEATESTGEKGFVSHMLGGAAPQGAYANVDLTIPPDEVKKELPDGFVYNTKTWINHINGFTINVANYVPLGEPKQYAEEYYSILENDFTAGNFTAFYQSWCENQTPDKCGTNSSMVEAFGLDDKRTSFTQGGPKLLGACNGEKTYNPVTNLRNYAALLKVTFPKMNGNNGPIILADTSRNGGMEKQYYSNQKKYGITEPCASWCNITGEYGPTIGVPTFKDNGKDFNITKAQPYLYYMYLKPPGESDGCVTSEDLDASGPQPDAGLPGTKACTKPVSCPKFDTMCGIQGTRGYNSDTDAGTSEDKMCPPKAGIWDDNQFTTLIKNFLNPEA